MKFTNNDRSSINGSISKINNKKKTNLPGNESFLDLSALNDSFLSSV